MTIRVEKVTAAHPFYSQILYLREEVLRKPIGLSLKDVDLRKDELDITLAAIEGDKIVGCVMLQTTNDPRVFKLRQMAVSLDRQRRGIGRKLVAAAEELLRSKHICKITLHARITASGFYSKAGYNITSEPFIEVGIQHVTMEKAL